MQNRGAVVSYAAITDTLSSFFMTFALAQLVVGPLADRYGRKKLVLGGLSLFIVGTQVVL